MDSKSNNATTTTQDEMDTLSFITTDLLFDDLNKMILRNAEMLPGIASSVKLIEMTVHQDLKEDAKKLSDLGRKMTLASLEFTKMSMALQEKQNKLLNKKADECTCPNCTERKAKTAETKSEPARAVVEKTKDFSVYVVEGSMEGSMEDVD
jgi:hypothetical protein